MKYYPAFLDAKDKKAVVVGGGAVAERKVRRLIKSGASVKVISPGITSGLLKLQKKNTISCTMRNYRKGDLKGALIVVAATSSIDTNRQVAKDAPFLVNVVDPPEEGNFIVPSSINRGSLTIAISTEGASPAVSKALRKEIETRYDRDFSKYLKLLEKVRQEAMTNISDRRKRERFLKSLASETTLEELRQKGFDSISKKIRDSLSASK